MTAKLRTTEERAMTEDEFDPLPADMMRARRAGPPTGFEKQWGIPARNVGLVADSDSRDRAVIARIGGRKYRQMIHDRAGKLIARGVDPLSPAKYLDSTVRAYAEAAASLRDARPALLPEAAFDWPVYRAALGADAYGDSDAFGDLSQSVTA